MDSSNIITTNRDPQSPLTLNIASVMSLAPESLVTPTVNRYQGHPPEIRKGAATPPEVPSSSTSIDTTVTIKQERIQSDESSYGRALVQGHSQLEDFISSTEAGYDHCEIHSAEMLEKNIVCMTCKQLICGLCLAQLHNGHHILSINKIRETKIIRDALNGDLAKLQSLQQNLVSRFTERKQLRDSIKQSTHTLLDQIDKAFQQLQDILESKHKEVVTHVRRFERTNVEEVTKNLEVIKSLEQSATRMIICVEKFFDRLDIQSASFLPDRLREVIESVDKNHFSPIENKEKYLPEVKFAKFISSIEAVASICKTIHPEASKVVWSKITPDSKNASTKSKQAVSQAEQQKTAVQSPLSSSQKQDDVPSPSSNSQKQNASEVKKDVAVEKIKAEVEAEPTAKVTATSDSFTKLRSILELPPQDPALSKGKRKLDDSFEDWPFKKPRTESTPVSKISSTVSSFSEPEEGTENKEKRKRNAKAGSASSGDESDTSVNSSSSSTSSKGNSLATKSKTTGSPNKRSQHPAKGRAASPQVSGEETKRRPRTPRKLKAESDRDGKVEEATSCTKTVSKTDEDTEEGSSTSETDEDKPNLDLVKFDIPNMQPGCCVLVKGVKDMTMLGKVSSVSQMKETDFFEVQWIKGDIGDKQFKVYDHCIKKSDMAHIDSAVAYFDFEVNQQLQEMSKELTEQLKLASKQPCYGERMKKKSPKKSVLIPAMIMTATSPNATPGKEGTLSKPGKEFSPKPTSSRPTRGKKNVKELLREKLMK